MTHGYPFNLTSGVPPSIVFARSLLSSLSYWKSQQPGMRTHTFGTRTPFPPIQLDFWLDMQ